MPAVSRAGDSVSTGHGCDTITTLAGTQTGSTSNVYINGIVVSCVGDATVVHTLPGGSSCVPHIEYVKSGSSTVKSSGKSVATIGSSCDSGVIISGSASVFAG